MRDLSRQTRKSSPRRKRRVRRRRQYMFELSDELELSTALSAEESDHPRARERARIGRAGTSLDNPSSGAARRAPLVAGAGALLLAALGISVELVAHRSAPPITRAARPVQAPAGAKPPRGARPSSEGRRALALAQPSRREDRRSVPQPSAAASSLQRDRISDRPFNPHGAQNRPIASPARPPQEGHEFSFER